MNKHMSGIIIIILLSCGLLLGGVSMATRVSALCRQTCRTSLTETISPIPPARTVTAGAQYMVAGLLSYTSGSKPIAGKTITISGSSPTIAGSTTTGDTGRYIFQLSAPGTPGQYKVIVQFTGVPGLAPSGANSILTVTTGVSGPNEANVNR
jgi:hypothetical protein